MRNESTITQPPEVMDLERLRLRRPRLSDAAAIFEYASDPEVARYAVWPISSSIEAVTERIRGREDDWRSGSEFMWVLALPSNDRAIGGVSCRVSEYEAEFGFLVNRSHWRNGYATEASRAVVDWIFSVPSVWRLWATCDVENLASVRLLEKLGLAQEGILRRAIVRPNISMAPRDAYMYSKVRDDV